MTDDRRTQRIGRREIDLWREHQIARCEAQRTKLEALEREMRGVADGYHKDPDEVAQARGDTWSRATDKLTAILNDAPEG
jgi:hypothetical protein